PLLDYYQRAGVLVRINGDQPVEAVHRALLEALTSGRS
ncbi:MAG: adenylate kinase, partial [Chloroflexi bacterium]|nr:adenylate kinase [Chloroflexota bacterium]